MNHILLPARAVLAFAILALLAVCAAVAAAPAGARTALAELRVEGPNGTLDPGTWYVTGTERVKRGRGDGCDPRKGRTTFRGPTALGLPASAQRFNDSLRPVRFRNTDLGPQLCQIGRLRSFGSFPGDSGGWLYWVNYVSGFSSPDLAVLESGDRLLWHYSQFGSDPVNTGQPLELRGVPARDADGDFVARVVVHDFGGAASAVNDATIDGAVAAVPLGGGRYDVTVGGGNSMLTAERGLDIRSNHPVVCVKPRLRDCPRAHGRTIFGSDRGDRLRGTRGWDEIHSGGGGDVVDISQGGDDAVSCGGGDDVVRGAGADDQVAASCERVRSG